MDCTPSSCPFILIPEDSRLTVFPIARPKLFEWYIDSTRCYWTVQEISTSVDVVDYATKLIPGERRLVKFILAFFAASDRIVNINLAERFKKDVPILEAQFVYDFQIMMENVHAHMYSILVEAIIPSKAERDEIFNAIETMPIIGKMSKYMTRCISSDAPFAERLIRMACVEGLFFTGCFCVIYWLQQRGLMPALGHSNELIARDEALHTMFAMFLYTMLSEEHQLSDEKLREVVCEAVELAKELIAEALPDNLQEMNAHMMNTYIECQADNLVTLLDKQPIYGSRDEFHFMEQINLKNRTNFFERRVSNYAKRVTADSAAWGVSDEYTF